MVVQIESLPVLKATRWAKDDDVETNFLIHELEGNYRGALLDVAVKLGRQTNWLNKLLFCRGTSANF